MKTPGVFGSIFGLMCGVFLFSAGQVFAGQYSPYEGKKPSPNISVDKRVGLPQAATKGGEVTYTYVDNLTASDRRFSPQEYVFFEVKVKNTSKTRLDNVVMRDFAPEFVDLYENPGSFDGKDVVINVGTLQADEEKTYILKARIKMQSALPSDKGILCTINKVRASNDKVADEDTSQFCIEKNVTAVNPPVAIPRSGPEHGLLIMCSALASIFAGLKLRKSS